MIRWEETWYDGKKHDKMERNMIRWEETWLDGKKHDKMERNMIRWEVSSYLTLIRKTTVKYKEMLEKGIFNQFPPFF